MSGTAGSPDSHPFLLGAEWGAHRKHTIGTSRKAGSSRKSSQVVWDALGWVALVGTGEGGVGAWRERGDEEQWWGLWSVDPPPRIA